MRQLQNDKIFMYDKCIDPKIDKEKSILTFMYDGNKLAITGELV